MTVEIKLAIFEDHQSIIDGYLYRLREDENIHVVATAAYGEELEQVLDTQSIDVLIMDVNVPTAADNQAPFPVVYVINQIIQKHPDLNILVISMLGQQTLIKELVDAGISGYIFKQDSESIRELARIVLMIAHGGIYFSQEAYQKLRNEETSQSSSTLTARQIEALSLCASYPNDSTAQIASKMGVAGSTLRNFLSGAYLRLNVRTRSAAIARLQQLGLILPNSPDNSK